MDKRLSKQTVLVVDDTPANIDVLVALLSEAYEVKVAINGERALKIAFSDQPPDIILLDIMMPGMDGFDVIRELKKSLRTEKIPVIFVTAAGETQKEEEGLDLGAVDYILKPYNAAIVKRRVEAHLALYDQNRALEEQISLRTLALRQTRLEIILKIMKQVYMSLG
ncbi:MAG: response regulator [Nitrosomonas sp.]|nr:response regulator [Nitrosomonas sp.]